ncbi:hypothetical protein [Mycolicibacterium sediminis]|nr:hypothetical protein [Mycolicibacterium sediminis]
MASIATVNFRLDIGGHRRRAAAISASTAASAAGSVMAKVR